jgi:two-component system, sensor histidine kinase and response regulator
LFVLLAFAIMNSSPYGSSALPDDRPPATGLALDPVVLKDLQRLQPRDGVAFVNRLLRLYRDTLDKHQQAISAAWAARHFNVIQDSAHALKSASANIGARELAEVCQTLEQALRHERWDDASRWVPPCLDTLERTTVAVDALLGRSV